MKTKNINLMQILLVIVAFAPMALASVQSVRIIEFSYDTSGLQVEMQVTKSTMKLGYYPDLRINAQKGLRVAILDKNGDQLYTREIDNPSLTYIHEYNGTRIKGGLGNEMQSDFAVILPVLQNESVLVITDDDGKQLLSHPLSQDSDDQKSRYSIMALIIGITVLVAIYFAAVRIKKNR